MSTPVLNPINVRFPFELKDQPHEVVQAHRYAFQGLVDVNQAIASLRSQIVALKPSVPTSKGGSTSTSIVINNSSLSGLGAVRDETGSTSYTNVGADNGILLILNDASPVAVTLDSAMISPYAIFITNFGAGTVTLTPTTGTINGGASLNLLQGQFLWCVFDGTNWKTGAFTTPPDNTPAIAHEFFTAYDAATGVFTQAQPDYSDLTGTPQLPNTLTPVAGEYLTGYDSTTGNFSQSTTPGISATIVTAQLTPTGAQGSMTFVDGILTASTPAT